MDEKELVVLADQQNITRRDVLSAAQQIRKVFPKVTDKVVARYIAAGFVGETLDLAIDLTERHNTTLPHIVRWHKKLRISMPRLKLCLAIRDEYGEHSMTVKIINRFLASMGFSEFDPEQPEEIPDSVMAILETIMGTADRLGGSYPVHYLWIKIDELYGADVIEAYHTILADEDIFIQVIRGKLTREEAKAKLYQVDRLDEYETILEENLDFLDLRDSDQRCIERLLKDAGE